MPLNLKRMREAIVAHNRAAVADNRSANPVIAQLEADLKKDIAELKMMESFQHRAYAKREKFNNYWHYVQGIIKQNEAINDNVTRTMLVWSADAQLVEPFIAIATYMLKFDIPMPGGFKTSLASFIVDSGRSMLTTENEHFKGITATEGEKINALIESIQTPEQQPNDEAYSKFLKALAQKVEALDSLSALKRAGSYYEKALMLNEKVGVKQDLTRVTKAIANRAVD